MQKAIAIDFDGTLCTNDYPNIGEPNWEIIAEAKMEQANGAGLILWTCREGEMLDAALKACEEWELHFDAVNESLPSWKKEYGNNPRKVGASEYWDDRSVRVRNGRFEHPENLKPDETRKRIVELLGDVPRIELFARKRTPGWDAWGDELE